MSVETLCRVCLVDNLKLYEVRNDLQNAYERITREKYYRVGYPVSICYICLSVLQKCQKFVETAQDTNNTLQRWYNQQNEVIVAKPLSTYSVTKVEIASIDHEDILPGDEIKTEVEEEEVVQSDYLHCNTEVYIEKMETDEQRDSDLENPAHNTTDNAEVTLDGQTDPLLDDTMAIEKTSRLPSINDNKKKKLCDDIGSGMDLDKLLKKARKDFDKLDNDHKTIIEKNEFRRDIEELNSFRQNLKDYRKIFHELETRRIRRKEINEFNKLLREIDLLNKPRKWKRKKNAESNRSKDKQEPKMARIPIKRIKIYRIRWDPMKDLTDDEFKASYKFSKENMMKLVDIVRTDLERDARGGYIPVELQVMAAVRYWGSQEGQQHTAEVHGMSQCSLSKVARRVAIAFASKISLYINMPSNSNEEKTEAGKIQAISGLKDICGVIGCIKVKTRKNAGNKNEYYMYTQIVCNADLKICDVTCDMSENTNELSLYNDSSIKRRFEENEFEGKLLGDNSYPQSAYLIAPVPLPETFEEKLFNEIHKKTYSTINKCICAWKNRFPILNDIMKPSCATMKSIITTCAILHNFAVSFGEELDLSDDQNEDQIPDDIEDDDDENVVIEIYETQ